MLAGNDPRPPKNRSAALFEIGDYRKCINKAKVWLIPGDELAEGS